MPSLTENTFRQASCAQGLGHLEECTTWTRRSKKSVAPFFNDFSWPEILKFQNLVKKYWNLILKHFSSNSAVLTLQSISRSYFQIYSDMQCADEPVSFDCDHQLSVHMHVG